MLYRYFNGHVIRNKEKEGISLWEHSVKPITTPDTFSMLPTALHNSYGISWKDHVSVLTSQTECWLQAQRLQESPQEMLRKKAFIYYIYYVCSIRKYQNNRKQ